MEQTGKDRVSQQEGFGCAACRILPCDDSSLDTAAKDLAERHWPGALTMVLGDEGFRVPAHDWTRRLLAKCGGVLRVTSANLSGCRPATDAPQALADVGLSADMVLDDGVSPGGVASTVLRISADGTFEVLRKGAVEI